MVQEKVSEVGVESNHLLHPECKIRRDNGYAYL